MQSDFPAGIDWFMCIFPQAILPWKPCRVGSGKSMLDVAEVKRRLIPHTIVYIQQRP